MKSIAILLLFLFIFLGSFSQDQRHPNPEATPRLVVGIVVDQMRWDYLQRYKSRFGKDGFNRLMREGFSYNNTYIPYLPPVTAAGHASIYTGAMPAFHGIVGNDWVERGNEKPMYCTEDNSVKPVGGSLRDGRMSPRNLHATTIGDQMKMAYGFNSRVFGVSIKDRGSILPAGRSGNAAYWFDDSTGGFISSSWYMRELPRWVMNFNAGKYSARMLGKGWNTLYPITTYKTSSVDDMEFERNLGARPKHTFPYVFNTANSSFGDFRRTPFANTATFDFSKELLIREQLGTQDVPDMLCISLSATDYVGHLFGPDAVEVEDTYLRLDLDIASFLKTLDSLYDKDYLVFLTSDHGAPHSPGYMNAKKISAGSMNAYRIKDTLDEYCRAVFNVKGLVKKYSEYQFYLDRILIREKGLDAGVIADTIVQWLLRRDEVLSALRLDQLQESNLPETVKEMISRGYHSKRSGDVHFIMKPNYTDYLLTGTDHGSTYNYDTHIPLIWFGKGIRSGETYRKVFMTDIAPTVCAILKIQSPDAAFGDVLQEIVR